MYISIGGYPCPQGLEGLSGGATGNIALQIEPGAVTRAGKPVRLALHGAAKVRADQTEGGESSLGAHEQSRNIRQDRARPN
jgi:hypothetical protein